MGRHSAPDADLEEDEALAADTSGAGSLEVVAAADEGVPRGRHSRADEDVSAIAVPSGTRGDLQLLREHPRLQLRCAAAVVVPFALYTLIMFLLDRTDVYLIWVWIPTVLAGVLIGAFLDRAHKRLSAPPPDRP